jgi:hypothetical protein
MTTTSSVNPAVAAPVAAPVKAPEATSKAQWINTIDMNFNTTKAVWNYPTSENCLVYTAGKAMCAALAAITFVAELLQNSVYLVANTLIVAANGVHSLFVSEEPKKPEPAPAPAPAVPVAPAKVEEEINVLDPKPRTAIVKEAVVSGAKAAGTYLTTHKAVVATGTTGGAVTAAALSYFGILGGALASATGIGTAVGLGVGAHYAANRYFNKAAAPVAAAPAPVAAASVAAPRVAATAA